MNQASVLTLACLVIWSLAWARAESADEVAAVVNGVPITEAELDYQVAHAFEQPDKNLSDEALKRKMLEIRQEKLNALIARLLLIQEFKSEGLVLPESYVDDRVADIVKQEYRGDEKAFRTTLEERGVALEHYRDEIRDNAMVGFMRNKKLDEFKSANPNREVPASFWTDWLKSLRGKASVKILEDDLK